MKVSKLVERARKKEIIAEGFIEEIKNTFAYDSYGTGLFFRLNKTTRGGIGTIA